MGLFDEEICRESETIYRVFLVLYCHSPGRLAPESLSVLDTRTPSSEFLRFPDADSEFLRIQSMSE